jgi:hypothetical protein
MYQMINLPTKESESDIKCIQNEQGDFEVYDGDGWLICTLQNTTMDSLCTDIADAIRLARDKGFEQGRRYVRSALGIEK